MKWVSGTYIIHYFRLQQTAGILLHCDAGKLFEQDVGHGEGAAYENRKEQTCGSDHHGDPQPVSEWFRMMLPYLLVPNYVHSGKSYTSL